MHGTYLIHFPMVTALDGAIAEIRTISASYVQSDQGCDFLFLQKLRIDTNYTFLHYENVYSVTRQITKKTHKPCMVLHRK